LLFSYVRCHMQTQVVNRVIGDCVNVVTDIKCLMAGITGKFVIKMMDIQYLLIKEFHIFYVNQSVSLLVS
jgi:hypothetical protein